MSISSILTTFITLALLNPLYSLAAEQMPQWKLHNLENKASLRGSAVGPASLWVTGTGNTVMRSVDGGNHWHDISVSAEPQMDFRDIAVFDDQNAIVMGVGEGTQSRLYVTGNGGQTWQLLFENPDEQGFFDSIGFWNREHGLLLGDPVDGYYVVMVTKDGGQHWQRIPKAALPALSEKEAAFAASGNTLITGANGTAWFTTGGFAARVYSSKDYGRTWQQADVPLHRESQTSGGYALSLNRLGEVFVMGGDYTNRPGTYPNLANYAQGQWKLADNGQRGLRTAMSCIESTCVASGKTASDISFDDGKTWQPLDGPGFYTLAAGGNLLLGAGAEGMVGVLTLQRD